MKTKTISITDSWKNTGMEIKIPVGTWFNASYKTRSALYDAKVMTVSQFLTTSNQTILEVVELMHPIQRKLFKDLIRGSAYSKRSELALRIIERYL